MIQDHASLPALRQTAHDEGMMLLMNSAMAKVHEGMTNLEAALTVATSDEE